MDVYQGGSRGSVEESKVTAAWPEYEADYLKRRLRTGLGKWDATNLNDAQQAVYLQEVAKHHETEADECLKRDFKLWLEGRHPTYNNPDREYEGDAERRHVYRTSDGANLVTRPMENWRSTPWGTDQLTHLPGVRQFLRDEFEEGEKQTLHMNLLAEHGPQTLEEAWMYFKHWVAERPLSEAQCDTAVDPGRGPIGDLGNKALFGSMPHHMKNEGARAAPPAGGAPPSSRGSTNFGSGTASAGSSAGPTPMNTSAPTPNSPAPTPPSPYIKPEGGSEDSERRRARQERMEEASREARRDRVQAARDEESMDAETYFASFQDIPQADPQKTERYAEMARETRKERPKPRADFIEFSEREYQKERALQRTRALQKADREHMVKGARDEGDPLVDNQGDFIPGAGAGSMLDDAEANLTGISRMYAQTASERRQERQRVLDRAAEYEKRFMQTPGVDYSSRRPAAS